MVVALNEAFAVGQISRSMWLAELAKLRSESATPAPGRDDDLESQVSDSSSHHVLDDSTPESPIVDLSDQQSQSEVSSLTVGASLDDHCEDVVAATSISQNKELYTPGMKCRHDTKGDVKVVRVGGPQDFFNNGRIYVSCEQLKKGCSYKYEKKFYWVTLESLKLPDNHEPRSSRAVSPTRLEQEDMEVQEEQENVGDVTLPKRACHERERHMPERNQDSRRKRGPQRLPICKPGRPRVSPANRILQFPDEPLQVVHGKNIKCMACKRVYRNKWSDIKQHLITELHIQAVKELNARQNDDDQLKVCAAIHTHTMSRCCAKPVSVGRCRGLWRLTLSNILTR